MKNDMKKRVLAGSMAFVVGGAGLTGVYGYQKNAMDEVKAADKDVETLKETAGNALDDSTDGKDTSDSGNLFKEESVYIKADPSGNVTETTVTEWLKNPAKGEISDESSLKDIKNVKGEETFTKGSGNELTWKSAGEDIYYQGTSSDELPVGVKVSYKLNGKAVSAKELDGKSGKVEIKIDYTNYSEKTVKIDKKDVKMYTPFTMVTAMMLSTDEYTNVEIDNGKVISDGDKNIVVGIGFPGLEKNLNLEDTDLDIDIPSSVKITADVKKATVGPTVTMASAELMNDFDPDDMDSFDDLEESLDKLEDAAGQLVDGSKDAADGAKQLADGSKDLKDGTKALKDGSGELADGSKAVADGSKAVADGIGTLNDKSGDLIKGVNSLAAGVSQYTAGVSSLKDGSKSLYDGAEKLQSAVASAGKSVKGQLVPGAKQIMEGTAAAKSSASDMADSLKGASSLVDSVAGVEVTAKAEATATATATVDDVEFANGADKIVEEASLPDGLTDEQKADVEAEIRKAVSKAQEISAKSVTVTETDTDTQTVKVGDNENYKKAKSVVSQVADGASKLSSSMGALAEGSKQVYGGLTQLESQLVAGNDANNPTLADGVNSLATGASQLYQGASALVSKNDALNLGTTQLKEGGTQLAGGVKQLADGSGKVADGAKALSDGSEALKKGAGQLDDGAGTLIDGTDALAEGNQALADGMSEFKEEGIDELTEVFDGDFQNVKNRLDAMSDMSKEYKSYAGIKDGMDGTTKFIIETEGIDQ